jgi:hypothetical protein
MADPTPAPAAPTGGDSPLSAPDYSSLQSDISNIEAQYEPQVKASQEESREMERRAIESAGQIPVEAERAVGELTEEDKAMNLWLQHTPTRQAIYATSMHAAPLLSVLTALGGKMTRLNGLQMLSAQNGIIAGLNQASEQKYNEALEQWKASFEAMRDHQARLMEVHRIMLTAYEGRADAYQKAADAARRMTGDILDDKQRQISQRIDMFKAQSAAWDKMKRVDLANRSLADRTRHEMAQEAKWRDALKRANAMPPELKAQLNQEYARWRNAKAQRDEIAKRRMSALSLGDTTDPATKAALLAQLDEEDKVRANEMDQAMASANAVLAQAGAVGEGAPRPSGGPAAGGSTRTGGIARPSQKQLEALRKHQGQAVSFGDGSSMIMDANGNIELLSSPTQTVQ